jgi:predicted DNA-binding protein
MKQGGGTAATGNDARKPAQVHVRVSPEFKRALKMFCVREGTTEQRWVGELIEAELVKRAPDLWSMDARTKRKRQRR